MPVETPHLRWQASSPVIQLLPARRVHQPVADLRYRVRAVYSLPLARALVGHELRSHWQEVRVDLGRDPRVYQHGAEQVVCWAMQVLIPGHLAPSTRACHMMCSSPRGTHHDPRLDKTEVVHGRYAKHHLQPQLIEGIHRRQR